MKWKHIVTIITLGVSGNIAMYLGHVDLAGVCFGAIAMWGFVNGAREVVKNKDQGT